MVGRFLVYIYKRLCFVLVRSMFSETYVKVFQRLFHVVKIPEVSVISFLMRRAIVPIIAKKKGCLADKQDNLSLL